MIKNKGNNKISVVVTTKNEEEKIRSFLESVKWADEIVVMDDESSDRTREICEKYGARVIVHKSNFEFDIQRNIGFDNTKNEWVMQMDSDEIVTDDAIKKIREAVNNPGDYVAFELIRRDHFKDRCLVYCGMESRKIKLFNKKFVRYKELGRRHEELDMNGKVGYLDAVVNHYPYKGVIDFIQKQCYYADCEAKLMLQEYGILSWKDIRYNLTIKPLKLFWKLHVKKGGYKDGQYGFIWNLLQVVRRIIIYMKYWEIIEENYENRN